MNGQHIHEKYMGEAIKLAREAGSMDEVPVGAVIVKNGEIIARGYNRVETDTSVIAHAEMTAIGAACMITGAWRLTDCILYSTLEPCSMCAGAIILSRIKTLVFGAQFPVHLP